MVTKLPNKTSNTLQQLSEIITDSGEPSFHGELGNITVEIFETMNTFENQLIKK